MADFMKAFAVVMSHEDEALSGVITPNGTIPETHTRFGVDERYHPELRNSGFYTIMAKDKAFAVAGAVYRTYWKFDNIVDQRVATKILDACINMGSGNALPQVQLALNNLGYNLMTWHWGPAMQSAINGCDPEKLLSTLVDTDLAYYKKAAIKKGIALPGGWKTRAEWKGDVTNI